MKKKNFEQKKESPARMQGSPQDKKETEN